MPIICRYVVNRRTNPRKENMSQLTVKVTDKNGLMKPHEVRNFEALLRFKLDQHPSLLTELLKHTHEVQFIVDEPNKQTDLISPLPDDVRQSVMNKLELHPRQ